MMLYHVKYYQANTHRQERAIDLLDREPSARSSSEVVRIPLAIVLHLGSLDSSVVGTELPRWTRFNNDNKQSEASIYCAMTVKNLFKKYKHGVTRDVNVAAFFSQPTLYDVPIFVIIRIETRITVTASSAPWLLCLY